MDDIGLIRTRRNHDARLVLAKPHRMGGEGGWQCFELNAKVPRKRHLGDGNEQSAVRDIVPGGTIPASNQSSDKVSSALLCIEVDGRRRALATVKHDLHIERLAEMAGLVAAQHQDVA